MADRAVDGTANSAATDVAAGGFISKGDGSNEGRAAAAEGGSRRQGRPN